MVDIENILAQYGLLGVAADDEAVEAMQSEPATSEPIAQPSSEGATHESVLIEITDEDASNDTFSEILSELNGTPVDSSEAVEFSFENNNSEDNEETTSSDVETTTSSADATTTNSDFLLPDNSPTLLLDDATSRFSGAEWYSEIQKANVIIGGMGGISSHLVFNIARMSPATIVMYDDDVVEIANMSGQLYSINDVGRAKVDAMENMLRQYTTTGTIYAIRERFTNISEAGDIMLCGFDNMIARKTFFNAWKQHVFRLPEEQRGKCLFLDGRLSLTVMQIFCITGDDAYNMDKYQDKYLFDDSEADETVCSMKQTTYLASMIGATMTNLFTNFIANSLDPVIPYTLPFLTEYDAQYTIFKTEN